MCAGIKVLIAPVVLVLVVVLGALAVVIGNVIVHIRALMSDGAAGNRKRWSSVKRVSPTCAACLLLVISHWSAQVTGHDLCLLCRFARVPHLLRV